MPPTAKRHPHPDGSAASTPHRVRIVAYAVTAVVVVVFGIAAVTDTEAWPITSFRLFSRVRTATTVTTTLVAVDADGNVHPVRADDDHVFVKRTTPRYAELPSADPDRARSMVDAWLVSAGMHPSDYVAVELHRRTTRLHEDGSAPALVDERTTWHLDL